MSHITIANLNLLHNELQSKGAIINSTKRGIETSTNESASEGELNSAKTNNSFSTEYRIRKQEPLSSKSRLSTKNMIEFEEFIVDHNNPKSGFESAEDRALSSKNDEVPAQFIRIEKDDQKLGNSVLQSGRSEYYTPASPRTLHNKSVIEKVEIEQDGDRSVIVKKMADQPETDPISENVIEENDETGSRRVLAQMSEKKVAASLSEQQRKDSEDLSNTAIYNEFKNLKDEIQQIHKNLQSKEEYNKKLEEQILSQSNQINSIIQSFNALKEENELLKKNIYLLMNPIKETIIEKQEIKQEEKEKSYKLEYVISRKVNKYYEEEISRLKQKTKELLQEKDLQIETLKKQLSEKNNEIEALKQAKAAAITEDHPTKLASSKGSSSTKSHPVIEHASVPVIEPLKDLRISTTTPNRFRPNTVRSSREEKEFKGSHSTRNLRDPSPIDLQYIKHMEEMSEKLNEIKKKKKLAEKEEANVNKENKLPPHPLHYQAVQHEDKSKSYYKSHKEDEGISHQKANYSSNLEDATSYEEEINKKSLVDISFDTSFLKDNQKPKKDSEDIGSPNMSPIKDGMKGDAPKKSKHLSQQNFSQINEMSTINEQMTENFVTDSIHSKIISELQSQFETNVKKHSSKNLQQLEVLREEIEAKEEALARKISHKSDKHKYSERHPHRDELGYYYHEHQKGQKPEAYYSNPTITTDNMTDIQHLHINSFKTPTSNFHGRDPQGYFEKENLDPYYQNIAPKSTQKKSKSAASSQIKLTSGNLSNHKENGQLFHNFVEEYSHLQSYNNATINNLNQALEKMIINNQPKSKHKVPSIPIKREIEDDFDEISLIDSRSKSASHKRINSNTTPLAGILPNAKPSGSGNSNYSSHRLNPIDTSDKENYTENYDRGSSTTTHKSSRKNNYVFNDNEELNGYNATLGHSSSGVGKKLDPTSKPLKSSHSSRHQTPNHKSNLEVDPRYYSKSSKRLRGTPYTENTSNATSFEHQNYKGHSGTKSKNESKPSQKLIDRNPYADITTAEYSHPSEMSKHARISHYQSSHDQVNYESLHPNDYEDKINFKEDNNSLVMFNPEKSSIKNVYESDTSLAEIVYNQAPRRKEAGKYYDPYHYESKKYM